MALTIIERLRHGQAPQPRSLRGGAIGEHGDLAGRIVEARKLEPRIERGAVRRLHRQRIFVAHLERGADGGAAALVLDDDETPRLRQSDRGRETGNRNEPLERALRKRRPLEAAHVAAPFQKIVKTLAKFGPELGRFFRSRSDVQLIRTLHAGEISMNGAAGR